MRKICSLAPLLPLQRIPTACALGMASISVSVMVGWLCHIPVLVYLSPDMGPMQFNTALGILIAALCLYGVGVHSKSAAWGGAMLIVLGGASFIQYPTGWDLHIDQVLIRSWLTAGGPPGRMGLNTAVCFVVAGLTFVAPRFRERSTASFALIGSVFLISISCSAVVGYLTGLESAYRWGVATRMALHTAIAFLLLGIGLVAGAPQRIRRNRAVAYAVAVGFSAMAIAVSIWVGVLRDGHQLLINELTASAENQMGLTRQALEGLERSLLRFADRWTSVCDVGSACERDAQAYLRDYPSVISIAWVHHQLNGLTLYRRSPASPQEFIRQEREIGPELRKSITAVTARRAVTSQWTHSPSGDYYLNVIVNGTGARVILVVTLDPKVMLGRTAELSANRTVIQIHAGTTLIFSSGSHDIPRKSLVEARKSASVIGQDWTLSISAGAANRERAQMADLILLAGITIASFVTATVYLWQTSRERSHEVQLLNAELEARVRARTCELERLNTTLEMALDREHNVSQLLRDGDTQLRSILDAGKICFWRYDFVSKEFYFRGEWKDLLRSGCDNLPRDLNCLFTSVPPEDRQLIWDSLAGESPEFQLEVRVLQPDASTRWLSLHAQVRRAESLAAMQISVVMFDITQKKLAELSRAESERQFRLLADTMPQIVWTATSPGRFDYFNRRWTEYTGIDVAEANASSWESVLHPDDYQITIDQRARAISNGRPYELEYRLRRASDCTYRWHLGRAAPIADAEGNITRWFGTCTDVEDYKRAEGAIRNLNATLEERVKRRTADLAEANFELARTKAELQRLLDAATEVAIVATDDHGMIRVFNPGAERMLGYTAGEIVGTRSLAEIHQPRELHERAARLGAPLAAGGGGLELVKLYNQVSQRGLEQAEWTYIRKSGDSLPVTIAITDISDAEGHRNGYLVIATDLTVRKSLERELLHQNERLALQTRRAEEANRAKSDFLAAMSHEIRTPMNAILGMADLLWETKLDAEQKQYLEIFRRAGSNLLTLINDILDLSKIESGNFELECIPFDLDEIVDQAVELMATKARAKSITLLSRVAPGVPSALLGDPTKLRQVLINLLGNAVKFTEKGQVVLGVTEAGCAEQCRIRFEISDTGIGIAPDKLDAIFEDFTQADSSTTRRYGGTGLGLGLSRRIVEHMGGAITVESTVGRGSRFAFSVPFQLAPHQRPNLGCSDLHGCRVLILDDNSTNRFILSETLGSWGMVPVDFESPQRALLDFSDAFEGSNPFALLLIDRQMPGTDGFDFARRIRNISPDVPIVMLSPDTVAGDSTFARELSLSSIALKPVTRTRLLRIVCSALRLEPPASQPLTPHALESVRTVLPRRLLVAEDSVDNRLLIQAYLKSTPHQIMFVEDGRRAIEAFSSQVFDLILMDVRMPVTDGLAATRAIRQIERMRSARRTPIVALTADASVRDEQASLEAGCDGHLTKPVSKQQLIDAIKRYARPDVRDSETQISVPPELQDIVAGYLSARRADVSEILRMIANPDFDRIFTIAHNLKGTGASYGFSKLTEIGADLESAVKVRDRVGVMRESGRLEEYLAGIRLPGAPSDPDPS